MTSTTWLKNLSIVNECVSYMEIYSKYIYKQLCLRLNRSHIRDNRWWVNPEDEHLACLRWNKNGYFASNKCPTWADADHFCNHLLRSTRPSSRRVLGIFLWSSTAGRYDKECSENKVGIFLKISSQATIESVCTQNVYVLPWLHYILWVSEKLSFKSHYSYRSSIMHSGLYDT